MRRFSSLLVCAWLVGVPAVPVALVPAQELAVSNVTSEAMKVHKVCCSRVHPGQQTNKTWLQRAHSFVSRRRTEDS